MTWKDTCTCIYITCYYTTFGDTEGSLPGKILFWVILLPLHSVFNCYSIKCEEGPGMLSLTEKWNSSLRCVEQSLILTLATCTENFKRPDLAMIMRNCATKMSTMCSLLSRSWYSAAVLCPLFLVPCPMDMSSKCHAPPLASSVPFLLRQCSQWNS